jgi:hypothetical protein
MKRHPFWLSSLLVITMLLGCSPATLPPGIPDDPSAPAIQTDRQVYELEPHLDSLRLDIAASYTNTTGQTVYPARCGFEPPDFYLEKRSGDAWVLAYAPVCLAVLIDEPFEVAANETYTTTLTLLHPHDPNTYPRFEVDELLGTYRLVYRIYRTWEPDGPELGELLPKELSVSNEFVVR